jgi:hypothetical protein
MKYTLIIITVLVLESCGGKVKKKDETIKKDTAKTTTSYDADGKAVDGDSKKEKPKAQYGGVVLVKEDYGDKWCLSVDFCEVVCEGQSILCYANGKKYPVNGTAKGYYKKLPEIEEIWLDNPKIEGTKISIEPLFEVGRKCQK